jgi:hypothetical protein
MMAAEFATLMMDCYVARLEERKTFRPRLEKKKANH